MPGGYLVTKLISEQLRNAKILFHFVLTVDNVIESSR